MVWLCSLERCLFWMYQSEADESNLIQLVWNSVERGLVQNISEPQCPVLFEFDSWTWLCCFDEASAANLPCCLSRTCEGTSDLSMLSWEVKSFYIKMLAHCVFVARPLALQVKHRKLRKSAMCSLSLKPLQGSRWVLEVLVNVAVLVTSGNCKCVADPNVRLVTVDGSWLTGWFLDLSGWSKWSSAWHSTGAAFSQAVVTFILIWSWSSGGVTSCRAVAEFGWGQTWISYDFSCDFLPVIMCNSEFVVFFLMGRPLSVDQRCCH